MLMITHSVTSRLGRDCHLLQLSSSRLIDTVSCELDRASDSLRTAKIPRSGAVKEVLSNGTTSIDQLGSSRDTGCLSCCRDGMIQHAK